MFLYRDVLKKSLAITFTHRNLWFLGIFAALLGGVGQYTMAMSRSPEDWTTSVFSAMAIFSQQNGKGDVLSNLVYLFQTNPAAAIIFSCFFLIIIIVALFILWLAVVCQGGLINNIAAIIKSNGKKEGLPIRDGLEKGIEKLWPMLGLNLIGAALTCFFAALVGLPLVFMTAYSTVDVFLLYILLFVIFIPLSLIISFLIKYSINFSVIKGKKFVDSFIEACRLFSKYWLVSLEMALILFMVDFVCVFLLALIILILAIPYVFVMRILSLTFLIAFGADNFFYFALNIGLFLSLIAVVMGGAMVTVFKTTVWTDVFIDLVDKKGGLAKLERLASGMRKKN
jgi:hypothetical protein